MTIVDRIIYLVRDYILRVTSAPSKIIIILALLFSHIILYGTTFSKSESCSIRSIEQLSSNIQQGKTVFFVYGDVDLGGRILSFPKSSKIIFKGGSLRNGKVKGQFNIIGVKKGSLSVAFAKGSQIYNEIPIYSNNPATDASVMSACTGGIIIKEDIYVNDVIEPQCCINGNGHTLHRGTMGNSTISLKDSKNDISFKNLAIVKDFEKESINRSFAVYAMNCSNIHFNNCTIIGRVYFVNNTQSDAPEDISENISIDKCNLKCDLSKSPQGAQYGQDHITFCSIKKVSITNCKIKSENVNRVLKTTSYFKEDIYLKAVNCCDGILFRKNKISANCKYGRQFWDFFCGTTNVIVEDNDIEIEGFTEVFEDKAYQEKFKGKELIESSIIIKNNKIRSKHSSLFQFKANSRCDSFVFQNNECHLYGTNKNPNSGFIRTSGSYLQGYKSCKIEGNKFYWEDEAIGLMFTTLNFDCLNTTIENNYFQNAYRVNMATSANGNVLNISPYIETFHYRNNVKKYTSKYKSPRIEVALEGVKANLIDIEINTNDITDDFFVSLNTDAQIEELRYLSPRKKGKGICILSDKVIIKKMSTPTSLVKRGNNWYHIKSVDAK